MKKEFALPDGFSPADITSPFSIALFWIGRNDYSPDEYYLVLNYAMNERKDYLVDKQSILVQQTILRGLELLEAAGA